MKLAIIFTIKFLGFTPKLALERDDAGEIRYDKIIELIRTSKYGIHDLSSMVSTRANEPHRLNMAFELGLDHGCRRYKPGKWSEKKYLVLEVNRRSYMKSISDINGTDIRQHGNKPFRAVGAVRDWFVTNATTTVRQSPRKIWYSFNEFTAYLERQLSANGYRRSEYNRVPIPEVMSYMDDWFRELRAA